MTGAAHRVDADDGTAYPALALTTEQQKLHLYHRLFPGDPAFNVVFPYRITGDVDAGRLRDAVECVVRASAGLNTTFHDGPDGAVGRDERARAYRVDVVAAPDEQAVVDHLARTVDTPMDPSVWPLYEFRVWRTPGATYLTVVMSHLIGDAFGLWALYDRITRAYREPDGDAGWLGELDETPADFVARPDPEAVAEGVEFFRGQLGGLDALDHEALRTERDADGTLPGTPVVAPLGPATSERIRTLCDEREISPFAFLFAGYLNLLVALTGRTRVTTGIPVANRHGRRHRRVVGYCINTLPVSFDLAEYATFTDLVHAVERTTLRLLRHQDFDLTAHAAEVFGRTPDRALAVDNAFTYYKQELGFELPGAEVTRIEVPRRYLKYPITVNVENAADGFVLVADHLPALAAARPLDTLAHVLDQVSRDPDVPLTGLELRDPRQRAEEAAAVGDRTEHPTAGTLAEAFDAVVAARPDAVAVTDGTTTLTYRELAGRAERVARWVTAHTASEHVGVSMGRRADLVAVLLGVLRAGRAYVPVDPGAPAARVRRIVDRFDHLPLIADPDALADVAVPLRVTPDDALAFTGVAGPGRRSAGPQDTAYVIFTSGSSGTPKGVPVSHRNVLRLFAATAGPFGIGPDDAWCLFHSYAFDFSVWEIFGALLHGGRLSIVGDDVTRSPAEFARHLVENGTTVLNQTPSAFGHLLKVLDADTAARLSVRLVVLGGEALRFPALAPWFALVGDRARLVNMYGITETTVHVTAHDVGRGDVTEQESVIGRPLDDLAVDVVDPLLRPVPPGVTGELLVRGAGVAGGYRHQPELSAERFPVQADGTRAYRSGDLGHRRPDGTLVYQGRRDHQVQMRGFRIELGEIESALLTLPGVTEAAVRLDARDGVEPRLVAHLVGGRDLSDARVRELLAPLLPRYMVPSFLVRMDRLPLTVNGKVDVAALPDPSPVALVGGADGAGPDGPDGTDGTDGADAVEAEVRRIWQRAVQAGRIGLDDNFFEVGGTSMHVAEVHRALVETFGARDLAMVDLFRLTTVRQLAAHLRTGAPAARSPQAGRRRTVVTRRGRGR